MFVIVTTGTGRHKVFLITLSTGNAWLNMIYNGGLLHSTVTAKAIEFRKDLGAHNLAWAGPIISFC